MSSNLAWAEPGQYRSERFFRYSVRCDMAQMRAIERAAKKAGKSATSFVQEHFDRILEKPCVAEKPLAAEAAPDPEPAAFAAAASRPDDAERARECGISAPVLRIWRAVSAIADQRGTFRADTLGLSTLLELDRGQITRGLNLLSSRGFISRLSAARGGRLPEWQVLRRET